MLLRVDSNAVKSIKRHSVTILICAEDQSPLIIIILSVTLTWRTDACARRRSLSAAEDFKPIFFVPR